MFRFKIYPNTQEHIHEIFGIKIMRLYHSCIYLYITIPNKVFEFRLWCYNSKERNYIKESGIVGKFDL